MVVRGKDVATPSKSYVATPPHAVCGVVWGRNTICTPHCVGGRNTGGGGSRRVWEEKQGGLKGREEWSSHSVCAGAGRNGVREAGRGAQGGGGGERERARETAVILFSS